MWAAVWSPADFLSFYSLWCKQLLPHRVYWVSSHQLPGLIQLHLPLLCSWYLSHSSGHQAINNSHERHQHEIKVQGWEESANMLAQCLSWTCFASCNIIQDLYNSPQMTLRIQCTWFHGNLHFKWLWGKNKTDERRFVLKSSELWQQCLVSWLGLPTHYHHEEGQRETWSLWALRWLTPSLGLMQ